MSLSLLLLCGFALISLGLAALALRRTAASSFQLVDAGNDDQSGRRHVTFFPCIRQAMAAEDFKFLASSATPRLLRRVRKERRAIALAYLVCLRRDFQSLSQLARDIARVSASVGFTQEFVRIRLALSFSVRYEMIRLGFLLGFVPLPELGSLNEVVSKFAMRLENALRSLGESAAVAAKLASSFDGRRLGTP